MYLTDYVGIRGVVFIIIIIRVSKKVHGAPMEVLELYEELVISFLQKCGFNHKINEWGRMDTALSQRIPRNTRSSYLKEDNVLLKLTENLFQAKLIFENGG